MTTAREPGRPPLTEPVLPPESVLPPEAVLPPEPGPVAGATRATRTGGADDLGQPLSDIGRIVGNITEDLSALVRQETELAKAEIKRSASRAGKGAGLFAGSGVAAHMALLFLSIALWWGIANLIDSFGWAAVIVGVLWAIAAAVMAAMGRKEMTKIRGLEQTTETAARIPDALKGNETTHG